METEKGHQLILFHSISNLFSIEINRPTVTPNLSFSNSLYSQSLSLFFIFCFFWMACSFSIFLTHSLSLSLSLSLSQSLPLSLSIHIFVCIYRSLSVFFLFLFLSVFLSLSLSLTQATLLEPIGLTTLSSTESGRIKGLNERVCGQIGVTRMLGTEG